MLKKLSLLASCLAFCTLTFAQLQSPDEFLPHKLGDIFTPHHMLVDYMEQVAANSPNVQLTQYGLTNEKRPLLLAYISSPENLARLEDIRKNNLRRTGLLEGDVDPSLDVAIVWLSFSVHGNEAAGSESSMAVIYELANPQNEKTQEWLKNTVVLLDPSLNPDGYSRYTHWYRNVANSIPDPTPDTREHMEPWPGGRVNHYLFDLNRDWAWQTQIESQQRIKMYHSWMPHIHPDLHEQGYNNPYYFAPAARPYHKYITDWQAGFQMEIGKNHAKHFDAKGWLYFTREVFDLFYPSYGDTYPTFNGAIGMTYEQAGHSRAGRQIIMDNGDTLTLSDRINHHKTTALSTVEIASKNALRLVQNFSDYFEKTRKDPPGDYKTFIIRGDNPQDRMKALCSLLDKNDIRYGKANKNTVVKAYDYQTGRQKDVKVGANDLLISAYQPLSILTQVLMEPKSELEDSLTYDITAWSLPYAYGLEAYASKQRIDLNPGYEFTPYPNDSAPVAAPYAYLAGWESLNNARFLGALLQKGIKVRYTRSALQLEGAHYAAGTLVITRADNRKTGERFDRILAATAKEFQQDIKGVSTGFVTSGKDLGSSAMQIIERPKIVVLSGQGTSSNSFGQVWYYFEQDLRYPIHVLPAGRLSSLDLEAYNLLILPEGRYSINDAAAEKLGNWISGGGRLIAIGRAVSSLEDKKGFNLSQYADEDDKKKAKEEREKTTLDSRLENYQGQQRRRLSNSNPGAIFKLKLDNSHPLGYGMPGYYFSLKTNTRHYQFLKNTWNVGTIGEDPLISGFIGAGAKERMKNTTIFAVQDKGAGSITYMIDNPLYRCFWENGKFLFSNAVFLVGQ